MITELSDLNRIVDFLSTKPYLFGVRSSVDIFYFTLGYCLSEKINNIDRGHNLIDGFCEYVSTKLVNTKVKGKNWGMLISFLSETDQESISTFHLLYKQFKMDSEHLHEPDYSYANILTFKNLVLDVIERKLIKDAMALSLFIDGYDMAIINNAIFDKEYNYYKDKISEIKESILKEFKLPTSLHCMLEVSTRYYSSPKKGLDYFISKVWA